MKGNLLKKIPPGVCKLRLLEELDVSDNQLKVSGESCCIPIESSSTKIRSMYEDSGLEKKGIFTGKISPFSTELKS